MAGTVLIVDDDPLIRTVLSDELSDRDFLVHVAVDECQALSALEAYPDIGVALVDYALPRPIGIGLCRRIATEFPDVSVALYTAHATLAGVRASIDGIPVLPKTLRTDQLVAALDALLEGRQPGADILNEASRVEVLRDRERRRETAVAMRRALHNQFDRTLREPLPPKLSDTVLRLFRRGEA